MQALKLKKRILVSVFGNICRSLLGFLSGVALARSLSPEGYGNLTFVLGSFGALLAAFDMGASTAFYTFISRKNRLGNHLRVYLAWAGIQFLVVLLGMTLLLPQSMIRDVWLGIPRETLILGFLATFFQQQLWQTITQIAEARRETVKIQLINIVLALVYFGSILLYISMFGMSVQAALLLLIGNYFVAIVVAAFLLRRNQVQIIEADAESVPQVLGEFWSYCRPLIILSLFNFAYDFGDRWMLQYFGGASQQGIYQVAARFSAIGLIVSSSVLNILWKEMAEAAASSNHQMVSVLYKKFYKGIFMLTAVVAGFLIPWAGEIVDYFLGDKYEQGKLALAIMFAYPIYQSMGQVGGTIIFALGKTRQYTLISTALMLFSIPLTYLLLASPTISFSPGFSLGALGVAAKMLFIGFITGNIQAMLVSRVCSIKFDAWHQFQCIGLVLLVGQSAKYISSQLAQGFGVWLSLILFGLMYASVILRILVKNTHLLGLEKEEFETMVLAARARLGL